MVAIREWLETQAVDVFVVSFAPPERLRYYQSVLNWPFPLFADPDRSVYGYFELERLPLWRLVAPKTLLKYARLLFGGHKLQKYGKEDIYQAGGDFLVSPEGEVLYAHRSHDPADRPSIATLRGAIG